MRVFEAMTRDVRVALPEQTIQDAAKMMGDMDAGVLPVREGDRLVGMITDRDIAVRAVALGKGPQTPVREVMSPEVMYPSRTTTRMRSPATWRISRCGACRS